MPARHHKKTLYGEKPPPVPPKEASFEELVEVNRERVRDLDANGLLMQGIASITRLPYAVIHTILSTCAKPKKQNVRRDK